MLLCSVHAGGGLQLQCYTSARSAKVDQVDFGDDRCVGS